MNASDELKVLSGLLAHIASRPVAHKLSADLEPKHEAMPNMDWPFDLSPSDIAACWPGPPATGHTAPAATTTSTFEDATATPSDAAGGAAAAAATGDAAAAGTPFITFTVKILGGATHTVTAAPTDLVEQLKGHVERATGVPVDAQRLLFKGKALRDTQALAEYAFASDAAAAPTVLHLSYRKTSAPSTPVMAVAGAGAAHGDEAQAAGAAAAAALTRTPHDTSDPYVAAVHGASTTPAFWAALAATIKAHVKDEEHAARLYQTLQRSVMGPLYALPEAERTAIKKLASEAI